MKTLTIIFALLLTLPLAFATSEEKLMEKDNVEFQESDDAVTTGDEIQMEEDVEYETTDGKEIEYDADVFGDDEIEIDD